MLTWGSFEMFKIDGCSAAELSPLRVPWFRDKNKSYKPNATPDCISQLPRDRGVFIMNHTCSTHMSCKTSVTPCLE
jgi:hypothetical protein